MLLTENVRAKVEKSACVCIFLQRPWKKQQQTKKADFYSLCVCVQVCCEGNWVSNKNPSNLTRKSDYQQQQRQQSEEIF